MVIDKKCSGNFCLPVLGLGTYGMGGKVERDPANDDKRDVDLIIEAYKNGITHFDTAEIYADGFAEKILAQALKKIPQEKVFITTKVLGDNLKYDHLIKACQGSLKRLGIKKIDLYLIHWPEPKIPLKDAMKAMDTLLENEIIGNIGVSNFSLNWLEEACSLTKYKIVNNQIHFNLGARAYQENGTLNFCQKHSILVTAYRPIHREQLTSGRRLLEKLGNIYQKTPRQIVLNWIINQPNVVTLFKTSNRKHLQENLGSLNFNLSKADLKMLTENFPRGETMHVP